MSHKRTIFGGYKDMVSGTVACRIKRIAA